MSNPAGRAPPDLWREAWARRFGICGTKAANLTDSLMEQLSFCKSDEARRLILGIKPKETHDH